MNLISVIHQSHVISLLGINLVNSIVFIKDDDVFLMPILTIGNDSGFTVTMKFKIEIKSLLTFGKLNLLS